MYLRPEQIGQYYPTVRWFNGWEFGVSLAILLFCYVLAYLRMRRASLIMSWKDLTTLALLVATLAGVWLCL